jgi:hypothetical protein
MSLPSGSAGPEGQPAPADGRPRRAAADHGARLMWPRLLHPTLTATRGAHLAQAAARRYRVPRGAAWPNLAPRGAAWHTGFREALRGMA